MAAECRDWAATLWPASYMGVPFHFESDESEGGRALAVHEFTGANDPYIEDLGRKARYFSGSAYVHGDDVDMQCAALEAAFETAGAQTLVLPLAGPVQVYCDSFTRKADKNALGYVGYSVRFVRAGQSAAVVSVPQLGQQIYDAADTLAGALAGLFPDVLALDTTADYVIAAAIDMVQSVATSIELVRTSNPVDATISAQIAAADAAITAAAPLLIASEDPSDITDAANLVSAVPPIDTVPDDPTAVLAAAIVATIRQLGVGMQGNADAGAGALLGLALDYPAAQTSTALSVNAAMAADNAAAIASLARLSALLAWCEALERQTFNSRPDGVAARAAVAERLELEMGNWSGAAGAPVFAALQDLQGAVVQYLTQLIANLAPVVTVSAPQSMPGLWWAWRLYGDPMRAFDLVLRNDVRHPSFMPLEFAALAPGAAAPVTLPQAWPDP